MNPYRVLRQASTQARLRARVGDMPDAYHWREFVQARGLEVAIEKMAGGGLGFWVGGLSRGPSSTEVERHCDQRLVAMIDFLGKLLPGEWRRVADWLGQYPAVLQMPRALAPVARLSARLANSSSSPLSIESTEILLEQSRAAALGSPLELYLSDRTAQESLWLQRFISCLPPLSHQERALVDRLSRLLQEHKLKQEHSEVPLTGGGPRFEGSWALRQELFDRLRLLFAGDPFQAPLVLVYGVMELIQLERLRGVLLMHIFGWSNQDLSGGFA